MSVCLLMLFVLFFPFSVYSQLNVALSPPDIILHTYYMYIIRETMFAVYVCLLFLRDAINDQQPDIELIKRRLLVER